MESSADQDQFTFGFIDTDGDTTTAQMEESSEWGFGGESAAEAHGGAAHTADDGAVNSFVQSAAQIRRMRKKFELLFDSAVPIVTVFVGDSFATAPNNASAPSSRSSRRSSPLCSPASASSSVSSAPSPRASPVMSTEPTSLRFGVDDADACHTNASLEERVVRRITDLVDATNTGIGFAMGLPGADIIFLESVLSRGGDVFVVLPCPRGEFEAEFLRPDDSSRSLAATQPSRGNTLNETKPTLQFRPVNKVNKMQDGMRWRARLRSILNRAKVGCASSARALSARSS